MFEFFKFGFIPGMFHLLFISTLPLGILFAFNGNLVFGSIIFFLGAPFFRSLRNSFLT
jgi:hypothetical protein